FNEGIGLMHIKAYGFDDNLILSGANLSHDYFNNRQDRYMLFTNVTNLNNYFEDLIKTIATFSFTLKPDKNSFKLVLSDIPDPSSQSRLFKKQASLVMKCFIEKWMKKQDIQLNQLEQFDTIIFPVIQMAPFSIRQDENATLYILDTITKYNNYYHNEDEYWQVFFTSGYFNFTQKYKERILNSSAKFRLLAASPEANGFYHSKGISKYIPMAYTFLEYQFFNDIIRYGKSHLIKIEEYKRSNWTFHAKGLWCYMNRQKWPSLTIIGSSNYGYRSTERDLEAQVILVTTNDSLRKALHD
ncbi:18069_t:CDS:2, partial [Racocetra persica]